LLGGPPRQPEVPVEPRHMHVARSIQVVTEEIMLRLAAHARELTGQKKLCLAGGVALNCVANGRILREKIFDQLWIQPAAGDAGGALGAALAAWHDGANGKSMPNSARPPIKRDTMQGALLGPSYSSTQIETSLKSYGALYRQLETSE